MNVLMEPVFYYQTIGIKRKVGIVMRPEPDDFDELIDMEDEELDIEALKAALDEMVDEYVGDVASKE